jgi:hypothetical protein
MNKSNWMDEAVQAAKLFGKTSELQYSILIPGQLLRTSTIR